MADGGQLQSLGNVSFGRDSPKTDQHSDSLSKVYVTDSLSFKLDSPKTEQKLSLNDGRDSSTFHLNSPKTDVKIEDVKMELRT